MIESDYASTIRRKMDDVYRNAGVGRGEKVERENRATFIVRSRPHSRRDLSYAYTRGLKRVDIAERSRRVRVAHGSPRKGSARRTRDTADVPHRGGRSGAREHLVVLEPRAKVPIHPPRGR